MSDAFSLTWLDAGAIFAIAMGLAGVLIKYTNEKLGRAERELWQTIGSLKESHEILRGKTDDQGGRLVRLEVLMENVSKVLERIEAKIDRQHTGS